MTVEQIEMLIGLAGAGPDILLNDSVLNDLVEDKEVKEYVPTN